MQASSVTGEVSRHSGTSDLVRSSALTGFCDLVRRLGGDPLPLLCRYHVAPAALERNDALISFRSLIRLMEATAAELSCPEFGLQLAREQDLRILGPIRIIAMNSGTVGDAINAMIEHIDFYSPIILSRIDEQTDRKRPLLTWDLAITAEPHRRQTAELALALFNRHMQTLTQGHFVPVAVLFRHTTPLHPSVYWRHFGARALFGQPVNALVARSTDLQRRLDNTDPYLHNVIAEYVKYATSSHPLDIRSQVEYFARRLLPSGRCTLQSVAQNLHLHERTLQRRLGQAGLRFEDIVEAIRRERAEELLSESGLSMAQIAAQLGYAKQSSFNRASLRWFGTAPRRRKDRLPAAALVQ